MFPRTSSLSSRTPCSGASRLRSPSTMSRPTCSSRPKNASARRATSPTRPPPFAPGGRRCRHNLNYWQFGDCLGIGAGAHGKLSFPDRVTRHARAKQPNAYMKPDVRGEESVVPAAELPFEFMLNALRLVEGFDAALFSERTGLPIHLIQSRLEAAEKNGLVERDWKRIRP